MRGKGFLFGSTALALSVGLAVAAQAQTAPEEKSPAKTKATPETLAAEIIVTGTRLATNGNNSPTPLTVASSEQLKLAAPTTLADGLAQVPEFRGSSRPSSFVTPQAATGAFLNLRGLGQNRVLTLFDGRRVQPTTADGRTDVNTFPDLLIKRVDIVTGGASSSYGSDAIAGVVNFVLDDKMRGLKGNLGGGISSRGDNASRKASLAYGTSFAEDRGHIVLSVDWFKSDGVLTTDGRDWDKQHCNVIPNPTYSTDGRTANLWRCGVTGTQFATGGVIVSGPLKGTQFLSGGTPATFNYGSEVSTGVMVGGDGYWNARGNVATPLENLNLFGHSRFDVNDRLELWAEGNYAKSSSFFYGTSPSYSGSTAITIYNDNAFLDATTKARMVSSGVTSFAMGRISPDWGRNEAVSKTQVLRGAAGLKGSWSRWRYDAGFDIGRTYSRLENNHSPNQIKLFEALDSVLVNGVPTCRSMLLAANAGRKCVALNPFGYGSASKEALDYVFGDQGYSDTYIYQKAAEINLRGSPLRTWAGEVAMAVGASWRRISATQTSDPYSQTLITQVSGSKGMPSTLVNKLGVFLTGNQSYQPTRAISVKEAYAEVQVPLARDLPLLRSLDANGSVRYADYSTTGGVWAWKLGARWEPTSWISLRATRSRDVRAPNITELYAPALASLGSIVDPVTGSNNNVPLISAGNPNLRPEIAQSLTAGVVLKPKFLRNFSISVDYYSIDIANAIGTLTGQNIVNLCAAGQTAYCSLVTRLADNTLSSINVFSLNQNRLIDRGVDTEVNYGFHLGKAKVDLRGLVSYLSTLRTVDPFGTVTEQAGVNGGETVGTPHWQGSLSSTLTLGRVSLFVQERIIGSGLYSNQYVVGGRASNSIDYNHVDGRKYTDLTLRARVPTQRGDVEFYTTINNLFDTDPPPSPTRTGAPASILGTNPTLYDVIGRQFNVGLRFKFN